MRKNVYIPKSKTEKWKAIHTELNGTYWENIEKLWDDLSFLKDLFESGKVTIDKSKINKNEVDRLNEI